MAAGGVLNSQLSPLLGSGVGRGIGLMFILMGVVKIGIAVFGYLNPRVRLVEDELPDAVVSPTLAAKHA